MPNEFKTSKGWGPEIWLGIIGTLIAFAALIVAVVGVVFVRESREGALGLVHAYWLPTVSLVLAVFFASGISLTFWRTLRLRSTVKKLQDSELQSTELTAQNQQLSTELGAAVKARDAVILENDLLKQRLNDWIPYSKDATGRWETMTQIRFGHLAYEPFLNYEHGTPSGLGVKLLSQLLGFSLDGKKVHILPDIRKRDWNDILEGLINREYDVVATPLFATFDRSKHVAFTAPLFFSNVGLFVSKETASLPAWRNMTVDNMKSAIKLAGQLAFLSVKGEISEKLAEKYSDKESIRALGSGIVLSNLFDTIANSKAPPCALFCESFYAHYQPKVKSGQVVNILPWHQILYPVCFAVRLGNYQLVNLLNIRLLEFTQKGGALRLLAKQLADNPDDNLSVEDVRKHFVAEWPCPPIDIDIKDRVHA